MEKDNEMLMDEELLNENRVIIEEEDYEANQVFMTPGQMIFRRFIRGLIRFTRLFTGREVQKIHLGGIVRAAFWVIRALCQLIAVRIVHLAVFLRHNSVKHRVYGIYHTLPATEIPVQRQLFIAAARGAAPRHYLGIAAAKGINGLLYIADKEQVSLLSGNQPEYLVLQVVRVLKLVKDNALKPL